MGFTLEARDYLMGQAEDFLFDDLQWTVRYLEAKLGHIFKHQKVLIPRQHLGVPQYASEHFPVNLSSEEIKNRPGLDFDSPVSRKYEQELLKHYNLDPYWKHQYMAYTGVVSMFDTTRPVPMRYPEKMVHEEDIDTNIRSFKEVKGYAIHASDDKFGHIDDLIIDDEKWQVLDVVIDTKSFFGWKKQILLPIESIQKISYVKQEVFIDLSKKEIEAAPEFDPAQAVNEAYEKVFYDFYGRKCSSK